MARIVPFSETVTLDGVSAPPGRASGLKAAVGISAAAAAADPFGFGYMFDLQNNPAALLPTSPNTVAALKELGATMTEPGTDALLDSNIPSAYTYFGQFVDHDITAMLMPDVNFGDPRLAPLPQSQVGGIRNLRTPWLDLDSVYSEAPQADDGEEMLLGRVTKPAPPRPPGKGDDFFDVPRRGRHEHVARIGDGRNDETTIISQLHVAFLRAHNVLVEAGHRYGEARTLLRRYYQTVVVHDFLRRVADEAVVDEMLAGPWRFYNPPAGGFFMPLEFSAAAFRFGHSMVRGSYDINDRFTAQFAPLLKLFDVFGRYATLPENWMILWEKFLDGGSNRARLLDTRLAAPLHTLPGGPGLPVRTLLRGYVLSLPTGQAVAGTLGLSPAETLTAANIENVAASLPGGAQLAALQQEREADDGSKWKLSERTPLWFYILAEAAHFRGGQRLGPVGSRLVAGVLVALVRRSKDSILSVPGWPPARDPEFSLRDFLLLARAL
jgi:hypothetical protein